MKKPALAPSLDALPPTLPIFPLAGVMLLPRGRLPLNIFEPRYISMVEDVMGGNRMIGVIQPTGANGPEIRQPIYETGGAGKITSFRETDDGRYLVTLTGICRFSVAEELPCDRGYRRVAARWDRFGEDLVQATCGGIDRARLLAGLKVYFKGQGISASWDTIEATPDERLITTLAMICPFEPNEKQVLLEAPNLIDRARVLITLIEMAVLDHRENGAAQARH